MITYFSLCIVWLRDYDGYVVWCVSTTHSFQWLLTHANSVQTMTFIVHNKVSFVKKLVNRSTGSLSLTSVLVTVQYTVLIHGAHFTRSQWSNPNPTVYIV